MREAGKNANLINIDSQRLKNEAYFGNIYNTTM